MNINNLRIIINKIILGQKKADIRSYINASDDPIDCCIYFEENYGWIQDAEGCNGWPDTSYLDAYLEIKWDCIELLESKATTSS